MSARLEARPQNPVSSEPHSWVARLTRTRAPFTLIDAEIARVLAQEPTAGVNLNHPEGVNLEPAAATEALARDGLAVITSRSPSVLQRLPGIVSEKMDQLGEKISNLIPPPARRLAPVPVVLGALALACSPQAVAQEASPGQKGPDAPVAAAKPAELTTPVPVGGDVDKIPDLEIRAIGLRLLNPETAGQVSNADRERFNQYYLTNLAESQKQAPAEAGQKSVPPGSGGGVVPPGSTEPGKGDQATKPAPQPEQKTAQGIPILTDAEINKLETDKLKEIARNARNGVNVPDNEAAGFVRWWERNADKIRPGDGKTVPPGESQRPPLPVIPREQIPAKINELKNIIRPFKEQPPLDPEIKQDAHVSRINTIERALTQAEEALAKEELDKARALLKDVDSLIFIWGAGAGATISTEEKKQHDPEEKYSRGRGDQPIRPELKDPSLRIIDLRRAVDALG